MDETHEHDDALSAHEFADRDDAASPWSPQRLTILFAVILIMIGAVLRLAVYLDALPFRVDELRVATNLFERSFAELVRPLDYNQSAPIGYLWLLKLATYVPVSGELALRFLSLAAGIVSLYLFYVVGRRLALSSGMLFALLIMALSPILLLRSADLKQYSFDGMVSLAVLAVALPLLGDIDRRQMVWLGVVGVLALFLSHAALFVVIGVGITLIAVGLLRQNSALTRGMLVVGAIWVLVLILLWAINLRHLHAKGSVAIWFSPDFMPLLPSSAGDIIWYLRAFTSLFAAAGITEISIAAILFLLGLRGLLPRNWPWVSMLLLPIFLAAIASGLHRYPFTGRLLTFAVPLVLLMVGVGFQCLADSLTRYRWVICGLLVLIFLATLADHVRRLPRWSGGRYDLVRVLEHAARNAEPDDVMLVAGPLRFPYAYYARRQGITIETQYVELPIAVGDSLRGLDAAAVEGRRAWVVIPHSYIVSRGRSGDPRPATRFAMDELASWQEVVRGRNVTVSLYEFDD
jgi:hypothetical protein